MSPWICIIAARIRRGNVSSDRLPGEDVPSGGLNFRYMCGVRSFAEDLYVMRNAMVMLRACVGSSNILRIKHFFLFNMIMIKS